MRLETGKTYRVNKDVYLVGARGYIGNMLVCKITKTGRLAEIDHFYLYQGDHWKLRKAKTPTFHSRYKERLQHLFYGNMFETAKVKYPKDIPNIDKYLNL